MTSLLGPAQTPWYFLVGSGIVMVIALATSKGSERGEDFLGSVSSIGWRGVFRYIACRTGIGTELQ